MDDQKKKGGRPPLDKKKSKSKLLWFSQDEFDNLNKLFNKSDYLNMNDMIRDILLNGNYRVITFDNDARIKKGILIEEVRRIGNNFNQLMKSFNQRKMDSFTPDEILLLLKLLDEIKIIYNKIESNIK